MASVNHKYCLQLSALCLAEPIMMISQLMRFGSVVSFLQKYRESVNEKMLLVWAQQIAEGMNYLESRAIVHRDLAARNILVKSYDHIKITDFGLAKILERKEQEQEGFYAKANSLVPVKWMAIESIRNRLFTHKSDVWSYGVCLWEIFTFCAKPYAELDQIEVIGSIIKGVRLARPPMASIDVYTILLRCWLEKPYTRPSFKELSDEFEKMSLDPRLYLSIKDVDTAKKFTTISENTQELLKNFRKDEFFYGNEDEFVDENEKENMYEDEEDTDENGKKSPIKAAKRGKRFIFKVGKKQTSTPAKNINTSHNTSPDEGIDTAGEMTYTASPSTTSSSDSSSLNNTLNEKQKRLKSPTATLTANKTSNSSNNYVMTFKRAPRPPTDSIDSSNAGSLFASPAMLNVQKVLSSANAEAHSGSVNIAKRPSNLSFFKNIFFNNNNNAAANKRLNSQMSSATGSTYVSSVYSDVSGSGASSHASPRIVVPMDAGTYDEHQALVSKNKTPSRSNSNSSSYTNSYESSKRSSTDEVIARNKFLRSHNNRSNTNSRITNSGKSMVFCYIFINIYVLLKNS
jgi:serine/threonine protein kinase